MAFFQKTVFFSIKSFSKGWFTCVFLLVALSAFAQRKVQGRVVDATTSQPLEGVSIKMWKLNFQTSTRQDGTFELFFPNAGEMKYQVELEGYRTLKIKPKAGENRMIALEKIIKKQLPDSLPPTPPVPLRFGSEFSLLTDTVFGPGMQHAAQLIQGQVAGLSVCRPGGNPNEDYLLRLRGLSTFTSQTSPLIVVDGLPESSLYLPDPNDITSFSVLKDASSTSRYGMRGISGVIEVETNGITSLQPRLTYRAFVSQDFVARKIPLASPEEFTSNGGLDFGQRTDWISEITRTPVSHGHHLSFSGGAGRMLGYSASMGYRNTQGILKTSGFEQKNARLRLRFEPWKDRLVFHALASGTGRKSDYGFPEAFRYAAMFNPTAPQRADDAISQQFGGWFETLTFESLNPVAILEQNANIGAWQQYSGRAGVDFYLFKKLKISAFYTLQEHERLLGRYISPLSLFEDGFSKNGGLHQLKNTRSNEFANVAASGRFSLKNMGLEVTHRHGFDWQRHGYETRSWKGDTVGVINLTFDQLDENLAGLAPEPMRRGARNIQAYFTDWQVTWRSFFFKANLRYEGTNFQENNTRYGLFYGWTGGAKVSDWLGAKSYVAHVRLSHGKTGGLFASINPSLTRGWYTFTEQPLQTNSEFIPALNFFGNTDFKWEEKREWNLGADFSLNRFGLRGALDLYRNTADDMMIVEPFFIGNQLFGYKPWNAGKLTNTGLECALSADLVKKEGFNWRSGLNFFTNRTTVNQFSRTESETIIWVVTGFFGPGGNPPVNLLKEGEPAGQLFGAVFDRVDPSTGLPLIKDLNKDGVQDNSLDVKVIGHAFPKLGVGWQHSLTWNRLDLSLNVRGMFGHDLANTYRQFRENVGNPNLNFVKTDEFIPGQLFSGGFSDRYVENASFLKLDYLALGYRVPLKKGTFRLFGAAQNLFTLTKYNGADPEPRLEIFGNPLTTGVETGNTYFRNQTLTAGLELSF